MGDAERTCIGCGRKAVRGELVRIAVSGDSLVVDAAKRRPGRGAWLCPDPACFGRAARRGAFARSLRCRPGGATPDDALRREFLRQIGEEASVEDSRI